MDCSEQASMLKRIQEMEFVAVELNLYLDTHPCDEEAVNDYNCAVEVLKKMRKDYEAAFGPLFNFGWGGCSRAPWQWVEGPWPWEI
jgi:spore coat protein JB